MNQTDQLLCSHRVRAGKKLLKTSNLLLVGLHHSCTCLKVWTGDRARNMASHHIHNALCSQKLCLVNICEY